MGCCQGGGQNQKGRGSMGEDKFFTATVLDGKNSLQCSCIAEISNLNSS